MARDGEGELEPKKAAYFEEAVADMQLPEPVHLQGQALLEEPMPMQSLLVQVATLTPDFQEGLLGNVWAVAWADGGVDGQNPGKRLSTGCGRTAVDHPGEGVAQIISIDIRGSLGGAHGGV